MIIKQTLLIIYISTSSKKIYKNLNYNKFDNYLKSNHYKQIAL